MFGKFTQVVLLCMFVMSTYRIDSMRERNKHLSEQFRRQREKLERMSGCSLSRRRGREDEDAEEQRPEVMVTLPEGDQVPARAALLKPSVRFTGKYVYGAIFFPP